MRSVGLTVAYSSSCAQQALGVGHALGHLPISALLLVGHLVAVALEEGIHVWTFLLTGTIVDWFSMQDASFVVNKVILSLLCDIVIEPSSHIVSHSLHYDNIVNPILALSEPIILELVLFLLRFSLKDRH